MVTGKQIAGIATAAFALFLLVIAASGKSPSDREMDASGYSSANHMLKTTCPDSTEYLQELINNDGILDGWEYSKFHKACNASQRDKLKQAILEKE